MKKPLAIVLGVSLAAGAAVAGEEGEKKHPQTAADREIQSEASWDEGIEGTSGTATTAGNFEDLDVNQDSLVSEQEATDSQVLDSEAFANADTNQDGYLSSTEYDASIGSTGARGLAVPETEHQEQVLEEDPSYSETAADRKIQSEASWDEGIEGTSGTETAADREIQSEASWDEGPEGTSATATTAGNFEDLDVNQDSLISEQEATDSQVLDSEAFANADTNQDGYLSSTEYDASIGSTGARGLAAPETEHQEQVLEEDPS